MFTKKYNLDLNQLKGKLKRSIRLSLYKLICYTWR